MDLVFKVTPPGRPRVIDSIIPFHKHLYDELLYLFNVSILFVFFPLSGILQLLVLSYELVLINVMTVIRF